MPTKCWTCGEVNEGAQHNCVKSLKAKVKKVETAYEELKEQALNAGLTIRQIS